MFEVAFGFSIKIGKVLTCPLYGEDMVGGEGDKIIETKARLNHPRLPVKAQRVISFKKLHLILVS